MTIEIRAENETDIDEIRRVHDLAFGQAVEGSIVDALRRSRRDLLSLVAVTGGTIIGHVLFSPATVEGQDGVIEGMGLAPMAVLPAYQRTGVGSMLVTAGIEALKRSRCPFVIVLGHEAYYPRFGFERASTHNLSCQWEGVPDAAFMVMILDRAMMRGASGVARYRQEFDAAM